MKISDVKPVNYDSIYKITDFDHFFKVYIDKRGNYMYNLNETLYFDIAEDNNLPVYTTTHPMQWPLISYKIYQTTRLAWLLMKLNDVDITNVFDTIPSGKEIRYLPMDSVQSILSDIN